MEPKQSGDAPDIMSCPPLVFLGAVVAGFLLGRLVPLKSFSSASSLVMGSCLGVAGSLLGLWGASTMHRARTSVRPGHPVTALVTDGPFRYSRNPLYLAQTLICSGIAMAMGSIWILLALLPALVVVHLRIVLREEQFLESRFGEEYRAYRARVRRWI